MSPATRALLALALAGALAGCPREEPGPEAPQCFTDRECQVTLDAGALCYPSGCALPGDGVVVEVTADPSEGIHAQDITLGGVRPREDLPLEAASALSGQLTRARPDGGTPIPYVDAVVLRLSGESALIPGVVRTHEGLLRPNRGVYRFPAAVGRYSAIALPADPTIPPLVTETTLTAGRPAALTLNLPAAEQLTTLTGRVERTPGVALDVDVEVQALSGDGLPLSSAVAVSRTTGAFSLVVGQDVAAAPALRLRLGPPAGVPFVPTVERVVDPRQPLAEALLMGDFGAPVRVTGRVLGPDGEPVAGADVQLDGTVRGGGRYRSALARTDPDGRYVLQTLPDDGAGSLALVVVPPAIVVPPPGSLRRFPGLLRAPLAVPATGGDLTDVTCPPRTIAQGLVITPDAAALPEVAVVATPVEAVAGSPLPLRGSSTLTGEDGTFRLALDPAVYRLDFLPPGALARQARTLSVATPPPSTGGTVPVAAVQPAVQLRRGKQVSGLVTLAGGASVGVVPFARLRFFRVVPGSDAPAELLAESISDASGAYVVTLP